MEDSRGHAFRDLSDGEVEALVESLNSLFEGELGIDLLVACGERAIGPLYRFLLHGKPSGIFVPRQRAVRALAAWRTEDVYETLRQVLCRERLLGVIETLGEFRRPEAVPELVAALEDDFCRSSAEEALRKVGEMAHSTLIEAVRTPDPSGTNERPSSRSRRRSALRLLESLRLSREDWRQVAALLHDTDLEIAARAGAIALRFANRGGKERAIKRMIEALPDSDWRLQGEIQGWLEANLDVARPTIDAEIKGRQAAGTSAQISDRVLRLLMAVRAKVARSAKR